MNYNVKLSDEVREALALGRPVIALESTIIAHGMPYPQNVKTALACERLARTHGAVPATIAIIGGQLCAGLTEEQIEYLGREGRNVAKVSRRDIPYIMAKGADGATTVAATMFIASGHKSVCNGRHRRRASRRGNNHGYFRRPYGAWKNACCSRLRGGKECA